MSTWQHYLETHRQQHVDELHQFLRIPSISSLPQNSSDVVAAAQLDVKLLAQTNELNNETNCSKPDDGELRPVGGA